MRELLNRRCVFSLAIAGCAISGGVVRAATVTWTGLGADTNWATPENWSSSPSLPTDADQARIAGNTELTAAQLTSTQSVSQLRVGYTTAGYLEIGGNLTVADTNESNSNHLGENAVGKIKQTGGDFYTGGAFIIGYGASGSGTYEISGGTLSTNYMFLGRGNAGAVGAVNQTGGTVTLRDGGDALRIGAVAGSTGAYTISAGSLSGSRLIIGAEGDMTTTATMTISGSASVSAGNAVAVGSVGNARLVLSGSRTGTGTNLTIGDRFTWSKVDGLGATVGVGTVEALIDAAAIADPTAMRKVSAGALTINPGSLLDVGFAPGATPTSGTWTIMSWGGFNGAEAANLSFAPGVSSNWSFNLDTSAKTLTVSYVPEPAVMGLLGLPVGLLLGRRRARH